MTMLFWIGNSKRARATGWELPLAPGEPDFPVAGNTAPRKPLFPVTGNKPPRAREKNK